MSPYNLMVPAHRLNLKYVGTGAICAIINNPSGSHINFDQIKENVRVEDSDEVSRRKNAISVNTPDEPPAVEDTTHSSPKDSVTAAFVLHMNSIIESTPPGPLLEMLSKFKERDWPRVEGLLNLNDGNIEPMSDDDINSIKEITFNWRRISSVVEDTDNIFLQEGSLLLSLVPQNTPRIIDALMDLASVCRNGLRDPSLPSRTRDLLDMFKNDLQQCFSNIIGTIRMGGNAQGKSFKRHYQELLALIKTFENQTPSNSFQDLFKRQAYVCLIELQQCQRSLFNTPEIAAFSKTLQAVAVSMGNLVFADEIFHVIRTTLRDADKSPNSRVASRLDAQCNEVFSRYKHLLSPVVLKFLKAQEEAVSKQIHDKSHGGPWGGLFSRLLPRRAS